MEYIQYIILFVFVINGCTNRESSEVKREKMRNDTTFELSDTIQNAKKEDTTVKWRFKEDLKIKKLIERSNYNIVELKKEFDDMEVEMESRKGISNENFFRLTKIDLSKKDLLSPSISMGRVSSIGNGCYIVVYEVYSQFYNYSVPVVYDEFGKVADYKIFLKNKVNANEIVFTRSRIMFNTQNNNISVELFTFDTIDNIVKYPDLSLATGYSKYIIDDNCMLRSQN